MAGTRLLGTSLGRQCAAAILITAMRVGRTQGQKKVGSITGLENAMWQLIAALLTVAMFVALKQGFAVSVPAGSWLPVLVLGLLNTGVGCHLYF
jgi:hypothetical protein